jgi:hypothetical protein
MSVVMHKSEVYCPIVGKWHRNRESENRMLRRISGAKREEFSSLGGVMVSVFATGPKGSGLKPGRCDGLGP